MSTTQRTGNWGEHQASRYLEQQGYTILARQYRSRYGEIDIIATWHEYVVFVEVKTRRNAEFATGGAAVSIWKQQKILATALQWMQEHPGAYQPRFDVLEVYAQDGRIEHIENAFA